MADAAMVGSANAFSTSARSWSLMVCRILTIPQPSLGVLMFSDTMSVNNPGMLFPLCRSVYPNIAFHVAGPQIPSGVRLRDLCQSFKASTDWGPNQPSTFAPMTC